jgi:hypothetical protein
MRGQPGEDVQQARLADACWSVDVEQRERRLGRIERRLKELDLGRAAGEPAPPARRQQVAERAGRPHLHHDGQDKEAQSATTSPPTWQNRPGGRQTTARLGSNSTMISVITGRKMASKPHNSGL